MVDNFIIYELDFLCILIQRNERIMEKHFVGISFDNANNEKNVAETEKKKV